MQGASVSSSSSKSERLGDRLRRDVEFGAGALRDAPGIERNLHLNRPPTLSKIALMRVTPGIFLWMIGGSLPARIMLNALGSVLIWPMMLKNPTDFGSKVSSLSLPLC